MGISAFAKRHPTVTYYGLLFAISWGLGLIVLGPDGFVGSKPISGAQLPLLYVVALAGPSVAGLLSVGLVRGRAGMQDLQSRLLRSPRLFARRGRRDQRFAGSPSRTAAAGDVIGEHLA